MSRLCSAESNAPCLPVIILALICLQSASEPQKPHAGAQSKDTVPSTQGGAGLLQTPVGRAAARNGPDWGFLQPEKARENSRKAPSWGQTPQRACTINVTSLGCFPIDSGELLGLDQGAL